MTEEKHPSEAKMWIGEEVEYEQDGQKLFVDGAETDEVREAIQEYPSITEVHFAHNIKWGTVEWLVEKLPVTVEVDTVEEVPDNLLGRVNVILRVPSYVDMVKMREGKHIRVVDFGDAARIKHWGGQKVYEEDTIIAYKSENE